MTLPAAATLNFPPASAFVPVAPVFPPSKTRLSTSHRQSQRPCCPPFQSRIQPRIQPTSKLSSPSSPTTTSSSPVPQPLHLVAGPPLSPPVLIFEFLATFIFIHVSTVAASTCPPALALAATAFTIASLAACGSTISGAHLNPAITLALLSTRHVPPLRAAAFIPLQLLASVLATYLAAALGHTIPPIFSPVTFSAIWSEIFPLGVLTLVVYLTAVAGGESPATPSNAVLGLAPGLAALFIGLTIFALCSAFPGILNPAVAFGRAVFHNSWANHWLRWTPVPSAIAVATFAEHLCLAPAAGRAPRSWLGGGKGIQARFKELGTGAVIAYGITNICYYVPVFAIVLGRAGTGFSGKEVAAAWAVTWAGSQVTKPIRAALAVAMAPFMNRVLDAWRERKRAGAKK